MAPVRSGGRRQSGSLDWPAPPGPDGTTAAPGRWLDKSWERVWIFGGNVWQTSNNDCRKRR